MSYEIVHTFGFSVYLVLFFLFLWTSRIPRTNSGSSWWAASISFALLARLSLVFLVAGNDMRLIVTTYAALNLLEKPLLLTGLKRFFNFNANTAWFWLAAGLGELWLLAAWFAEASPLARSMGYSLINAGFMLYVALQCRASLNENPRWLRTAWLAAAAMAVHWTCGPFLIERYPGWFKHGFLLGTVLMLLVYMSLLAAVLSQFQRRLLEAESKALDMAFLDPLTGLNNKRYMNTLFDHALLLATRPHHMVAIFYIDLDNFKPINDKAGHHVGDEVLKAIALRIKGIVRSTDICARVGGDEFIVIGTQLENENQAFEVAKKILAQMMQQVRVGESEYLLGASIGISLYPEHARDLSKLIQCADSAMYQVKRNGKSGYEIYKAGEDGATQIQPDA
ncbi:GGDEF domain-containing protein [Herbaspirillum sp. LeCh32-8]|uniref:GGDEF domain-containing protein n=1 Tax=Herbaspirillum sp. LeCh32-8 TaxID=2821356 RepID=UPI001AE96F67|nr:GGDEF domain-containing protein [Herbaspirillum sp. LeCh32-8]MBP0599372.1 GGDEF domain-containing protein [Herbaspirillum sp. LeCh32-8]